MFPRRHRRRLMLSDVELAALARDGDLQALETLLGRYRQFARAKSRKYFLAGGDADDLEQEALIGLFKAARDFRPDHLVSFGAFADMCITRQLISAIKSASRQKHEPLNGYMSISAPGRGTEHHGGPSEDIALIDLTGDPLDRVIALEHLDAIQSSLAARLSSFEVQVLELYVQGMSYDEIAACLQRGSKAVDNAVQRIKRKLDRRASVRIPAGSSVETPLPLTA